MLALIVAVGVLTVSLLRKDMMGVDTSKPVDTILHDLLKFGDDDETGVTIEGLPPMVEENLLDEPAPPAPTNTEDSESSEDASPSPLEAPPF